MNKFKLLESFDSGSNYKFGDKMNSPKNPKSLFDLSHLVTTTIPNAGLVFPLTLFECLPGDTHEISVDSLLRVLPQVVPLYSRQRLYIYAFYSRYSDLWNNWQVFIDKGYTGNVIKRIPRLKQGKNFVTQGNAFHTNCNSVTPDSYLDYLGFPQGANITQLFGAYDNNDDYGASISAMCHMMSLRIYRDYFMNKTEHINDRILLPDDDSRFRIDDDGYLLSAKDVNKTMQWFNGWGDYVGLMSSPSVEYAFGGLFWHEYPDDYFTSALPFLQRGNTPKLDYNVDLSQLGIDFTSSVLISDEENITTTGYTGIKTIDDKTSVIVGNQDSVNPDILNYNKAGTNLLKNALNRATLYGDIGLSITLEDIRQLAIAQTEMDILARTDGSYSQFGLSFFGEASKAAHDYRATYIGGTYKNIAFTEVLQTSATESGKPLGGYAGHGITGTSNSYIGTIHCDDYGMIMILGCIMPDIYYSQGLDRIFTDSLQAEKYLPPRSKLGLQPILNKEIYYAGNNGNANDEDNYLWAYQNPFDHLRYMSNRIKGKIADHTNNSFFPYTQSRYFSRLPHWGPEFSIASMVRKDYLASPTEDAYTGQFKFNIRTVREMPYKSVPASII